MEKILGSVHKHNLQPFGHGSAVNMSEKKGEELKYLSCLYFRMKSAFFSTGIKISLLV